MPGAADTIGEIKKRLQDLLRWNEVQLQYGLLCSGSWPWPRSIMLMIDSFTRPFAKTLKNRSLPSWPPFRRAPACLPACLPAPSRLWRPTGPQKFLPSMLALPASLFRKPSPGRIEIEIEIEIGIQIQIHIRIRILVQVQIQIQIQIHIHVLFKFKTQNSNANANSDSNSNLCGFALAFLFLARLLACGGCQTRGRGVWDGARVGSPDSPPPHSFIHSFIHSFTHVCMHACILLRYIRCCAIRTGGLELCCFLSSRLDLQCCYAIGCLPDYQTLLEAVAVLCTAQRACAKRGSLLAEEALPLEHRNLTTTTTRTEQSRAEQSRTEQTGRTTPSSATQLASWLATTR